jgi:S-adenosylmethionine-diacylgycerolhomoserine-N-methlytransferase
MSHAEKMDHIYRYQRYIYDITRKYFLLGRDSLLDRLPIQPNQHILEVGCGTGRNLVKLVQRYPETYFYGVDASQEMLTVAYHKLKSIDLSTRLILKQGLAEELHYSQMFGLDKPFDCIFFSYTLSMIPHWQLAIETSLQNLKVNGKLYVVDFFDQATLPVWFHKILTRWLDLFNVHYDPAWLPYFESLEQQGIGDLEHQGLFQRYTLLLHFTKKA